MLLQLCLFLFQTMTNSQPNEMILKDPFSPSLNFYSQPNDEKFNDPALFSQDIDEYLQYQERLLNNSSTSQQPRKDSNIKTAKKKIIKRKLSKHADILNSHFIRNVTRGKYKININISNLSERNVSDDISIQYVVEDYNDELLYSTKELIERVIKKLSSDLRP